MAVKAKLEVAAMDDCCPVVLSAPLSESRAAELAVAFAVLADPVRLRLLSLLASAEAGEACVCASWWSPSAAPSPPCPII